MNKPRTYSRSPILAFQFCYLIKYRICKVIISFRPVPTICYMFSLRLFSFQCLRMEDILYSVFVHFISILPFHLAIFHVITLKNLLVSSLCNMSDIFLFLHFVICQISMHSKICYINARFPFLCFD